MTHRPPKETVSALGGVPTEDDPLRRAVALSAAASRHGFDWPSPGPVFRAVQDELVELDEAWRDEDQAAVAHELGDVLLAACNLARHLAVDPSRALHDAASRFERRFRTLEARAHGEGFALTDLSMEDLEQRWQRAKRTLSEQGGGA